MLKLLCKQSGERRLRELAMNCVQLPHVQVHLSHRTVPALQILYRRLCALKKDLDGGGRDGMCGSSYDFKASYHFGCRATQRVRPG
jgi:hypothetical protein